jgi:serine/threonine protein kinase
MNQSKLPLKEIFARALDCATPEEMERVLSSACQDDAGMRAEIEALLKAHANAGTFMDRPALDGDVLANARATTSTASSASATNEISLSFLEPSDKQGSLGRLGHYEMLEIIGRGGMGIVFKAFDEKLQRVVAIKAMLPLMASSASARQRFVREARAAAGIRDEHVIGIHAVEDASDLPYLVMEYVSGISLHERLERGRLQLKEVLRIGMQTARGLAAAHAQGLIHRDIKPANILLENGVERVKITDFGLARAVDDKTLTQTGAVAGTPQFMAPEQARGERVDHRADLFGLGSLMYVMCTGEAPFQAESTLAVLKRVCEEAPRPVRDLNPDVPEWLAALINRLHAKDPVERVQSAAEVARCLAERLADLQQQSNGRPSGNATGKVRRWILAAVGVLLLISAVAALWKFIDGTRKNGDGPIAPAAPEFAVLARGDKPQRSFTNLADAVRAAKNGDTIEVQGNAPMIREPIIVSGKALRIRAAPGARPVLEFSAESLGDKPGDYVRLQTDAVLVLEGLEIRRVGKRGEKRSAEWAVVCKNAPFRVANCRVVIQTEPPSVAFWADNTELCDVRNCQFVLEHRSGCADWLFGATARINWDNNVMLGGNGPYCHYRQPAHDVSIRLTRNTFLGPAMFVFLDILPQEAVRDGDQAPPGLRVEATETIIHCRDFGFGFGQHFTQKNPGANVLGPAEAEALLRRLLVWRGQRNLYAEQFNDFLILGKGLKPTQPRKTLDDWRQFWKDAEAGSQHGRILYEGGDLWARWETDPDQVKPEDFRLRQDSAGKGAGAEGRDLGANVDLVGPGPAYERWLKTPEYQQWLKDVATAK